jgi:hypothetical protein
MQALLGQPLPQVPKLAQPRVGVSGLRIISALLTGNGGRRMLKTQKKKKKSSQMNSQTYG